jgi:hypothetical protein
MNSALVMLCQPVRRYGFLMPKKGGRLLFCDVFEGRILSMGSKVTNVEQRLNEPPVHRRRCAFNALLQSPRSNLCFHRYSRSFSIRRP